MIFYRVKVKLFGAKDWFTLGYLKKGKKSGLINLLLFASSVTNILL